MAVEKLNLITLLAALFLVHAPMKAAEDTLDVSVDIARHFNNAMTSVYEKVSPSVVVIDVVTPMKGRQKQLPPEIELFLHTPGKGEDSALSPMEGSGIIIDANGYILTNAHVVEGVPPKSIRVRLKDGREFKGTLKGVDNFMDVAVVKIDASNLPMAKLGDSDAVKVGQFAFALGTPFELQDSFSMGIVSAKGRNHLTPTSNFEDYIQTDASINPGSSGGPLCDIEGHVIGMNSVINGLNRGLGFAIPINLANSIAQELIRNGKIVRPWIGVRIASLRNDENFRPFAKDLTDGVVVKAISPESPAMKGNLKPGDIILSADNKPMLTDSDLQKYIFQKKVGEKVELLIWREGRKQTLKIMTETFPDSIFAKKEIDIEKESRKEPAVYTPEMLGMQLQDLTPALQKKLKGVSKGGVLVSSVEEGRALDAEIRPADIITEIDFHPVSSRADALDALHHANMENGILVQIERAGEKSFYIIK
ncbi:MAG: trypsin-like peptidase domain-containing protein [Chthoniobacterales bacterium]